MGLDERYLQFPVFHHPSFSFHHTKQIKISISPYFPSTIKAPNQTETRVCLELKAYSIHLSLYSPLFSRVSPSPSIQKRYWELNGKKDNLKDASHNHRRGYMYFSGVNLPRLINPLTPLK